MLNSQSAESDCMLTFILRFAITQHGQIQFFKLKKYQLNPFLKRTQNKTKPIQTKTWRKSDKKTSSHYWPNLFERLMHGSVWGITLSFITFLKGWSWLRGKMFLKISKPGTLLQTSERTVNVTCKDKWRYEKQDRGTVVGSLLKCHYIKW